MALFRITEPAVEPVTVSEARAWLKLDHTSEDALIAELIRAARMEVESQAARSLITQHWRITFDRWPNRDLIHLPRGPVSAILSVTVYGAGGVPEVLAPSDYALDAISDPARVLFGHRPETGRRMNGIEIDYVCGYGATGVDVPDFIRRAIKMLVVHFYEFRGSFRPDEQPVSHPDGFLPLLRPLKRVSL